MTKNTYFGMTYGIAASGKSTLVHYIQRHALTDGKWFPTLDFTFPLVRFEIIASDNIRKEVYKQPLTEIFGGINPEHTLNPEKEARVWAIIQLRIKANMKKGISTLVDNTALYKFNRQEILRWLTEIPIDQRTLTTFLMVVDTPLLAIRKWNQARQAQVPDEIIIKMWDLRQDKANQPDLDAEKWDFIYYFEPAKMDIRSL
jgi:predicted kinase